MKEKAVAELTFEQALAELDAIVSKLEEETVDLDQSIRYYERGQALAQRCNQLLEQAELRVRQIGEDEMRDQNA